MDKNNMKKMAFIICLALTVNTSFAENQSKVLKENITKEYSNNVQTLADAVKSILSVTGYHLANYNDHDQYAQAMLSQKLNPNQRKMINEDFHRAILSLVGDDFDIVINNVNKSTLLKTKAALITNAQQTRLITDTFLEKYCSLKDYKTRVAQPLLNELSTNPSQDKLAKYYSNHKIFFGFNPKDHIVAIASTQKQANALSFKQPEVFFILSGQTLKDTINQWSKSVGIQTYYQAKKDLIIETSSVFFGEFNTSKGALAQLLVAVKDSEINLKASFASNNVLVIKDNSYSQVLLKGGTNA